MKKFWGVIKTIFTVILFIIKQIWIPVVGFMIFFCISFAIGIFINPLLTELIWAVGAFALSLIFTVSTTKKLIADIYILAKGNKYIGTCIGRTCVSKAWYLIVNWSDDNGNQHHKSFEALEIIAKYPHKVNVYSVDDHNTNLGIRSVMNSIFNFVITMSISVIFVICIAGIISEIVKHGLFYH